MKIVSTTQTPSTLDAEAIIVGVYADQPLPASAAELDKASGGLISRLVESKEFSGELGKTLPLFLVNGIQAPVVMLCGLGRSNAFDHGAAYRAFGSGAKALSTKPRSHVGIFVEPDLPQRLVENAIAGLVVGCDGRDLYRAEKKQTPFERVSCGFLAEESILIGQVIGDSINLTRRLVNEPPDAIYPFTFAERARATASEAGMEFELWDQGRMQTENCNALLAVARGSDRLPCLAMMRHQGAKSADDHWLALVGKGVTFDSGGLSLKTSDGMKDMKCDMAGAATVVGAMQAIAQLDLPINVIGLMGLVENMPGAKAFKLGDVVRARSGKTIEVLNTDAEGRMVLADVLSVAIDQGADKIIDIATLTGACVVALGTDVTGAMTNDDEWCQVVKSSAESCGERIWQLPMFEEFGDQVKSEIADIKNIGDGRWGGAITAAKFLEHFVDDVPWVHLDIAGPAYQDKPKTWIDGGATGAMVRTLIEIARTGAV